MSSTVTSISEMATSVHVKDVLSVQLNAEYLNHNFAILKQCLMKINDMQGDLGQLTSLDKRMTEAEKGLKQREEGHKQNCRKIQQLSNNVGDDFMKKMYAIEQKTKNMYSFDETLNKLKALQFFMTAQSFQQKEERLQNEIDELKKIKDEFERYVPNSVFNEFKQNQASLMENQEKKTGELFEQIKRVDRDILALEEKLKKAEEESAANTKLIKQINFPELMEKNKKFREEMDQKMNDLAIKMKKKVGSNQLVALEQTMIQKLDKFLAENQKNKAEKNQTKDALMFLEKRIGQIQEFINQQSAEDDKDGLFTTKKVHCASCTKDLGKFQGKLGQYRPWSIFPCKELDPEKTGGFGYMGYLDKVNIKKGSVDDTNYQRLNRTAMDKERQNSPKRGSSTARGTNVITNFGSQEKSGMSLKDMYFRDLKTEKGERTNSKFFRVKKQSKPTVSEFDRSNLS